MQVLIEVEPFQGLFGLRLLSELVQNVLLAIAVLLAALLAIRRASDRGISLNSALSQLTLGLLIAVMVGYHVVFAWQDPRGLAIQATLSLPLLALLFALRLQHMPILACLDVCALPALLSQVLVRWGVFFDQKVSANLSLYPPTLPPSTFRYELLWALSAVGAILWIERRFHHRLRPSDSLMLYGMLSSLGYMFTLGLNLTAIPNYMPVAAFVICAGILGFRQFWPAQATQEEPRSLA